MPYAVAFPPDIPAVHNNVEPGGGGGTEPKRAQSGGRRPEASSAGGPFLPHENARPSVRECPFLMPMTARTS